MRRGWLLSRRDIQSSLWLVKHLLIGWLINIPPFFGRRSWPRPLLVLFWLASNESRIFNTDLWSYLEGTRRMPRDRGSSRWDKADCREALLLESRTLVDLRNTRRRTKNIYQLFLPLQRRRLSSNSYMKLVDWPFNHRCVIVAHTTSAQCAP